MKKKKIHLEVVKENTGYSATGTIENNFIATEAESFTDLQKNAVEAINLAFDSEEYTLNDIQFAYDLKSFFDFYKVINAKALSERIGMNQSLMAQYIKGSKKPSTSQLKRILHGVQQIGRELSEARFLM
ncbi:MAG: XRE family transcriptional regulator [Bacteroidetes bacterium HGW-Bacteroidetes-4]|jgi:transcriptional regulator with XRE-family HTH domain|nr:MAG: XRE family transcriptional regulator [Bacteroidetes bacterium HGW-Bacteroidetes-4]